MITSLAITDYLSDHQLTSSADDLIDQLIIPFFAAVVLDPY
jgi:hypothetical protein